ncbi:MAG: hypothetical protein M0Q94_14975, partial [Candidatus Cloacimonetes bacterium]|nr:hypothetical protein [Candidatus Cloacimonadota bacterium]
MPTDETNEIALQKLKDLYGDQISKYEYEVRKAPFLGKEPKGAFCTGMTRYRKYFKVSHIKLKDGSRIPVGTGCLTELIIILVIGINIS